jgi:trehalose 6-phosphate phosphatase
LSGTADAIGAPGSLSARLRSLSERLDERLALISGRSIADLERHRGTLPIVLAGSHGADVRVASGRGSTQQLTGLADQEMSLVEQLARREALEFEGKPYGAAVQSHKG